MIATQERPLPVLPSATCAQREALEEYVATHRQQAFGAAYQMTGCRDDAEDLLQEALTRACASLRLFDPALPFAGWFYTILRRTYIDSRRGVRARTQHISLERFGTEHPEHPALRSSSSVEDDVAEKDAATRRSREVHTALSQIGASAERVLRLVYLQEEDRYLVAMQLGCSRPALRQRLANARARLRERLEEDRVSA